MVVREYKKLEYSRIFIPIRLIGRCLGSSSNGWCSPSIGNLVGIRCFRFPRRCAMRLHSFSFVANRVGTCTRDQTCLVLRGGSCAKKTSRNVIEQIFAYNNELEGLNDHSKHSKSSTKDTLPLISWLQHFWE